MPITITNKLMVVHFVAPKLSLVRPDRKQRGDERGRGHHTSTSSTNMKARKYLAGFVILQKITTSHAERNRIVAVMPDDGFRRLGAAGGRAWWR